MSIPSQVKQAAQDLILEYGNNLELLGKSEDQTYYVFKFPEDIDEGFPCVFISNGDDVLLMSGFDALTIINSFIKD